MQNLTGAGQDITADLARRYRLSTGSIMTMLAAVHNGGGVMAQFNCPELGGSGQWMLGGMTMVGDMFHHGLKTTVDNMCRELSSALAGAQIFTTVESEAQSSNRWWPEVLGIPFSTGAQNNHRYAVFNRRLAVEADGRVTVYDTLDHVIGGVSQQQGTGRSLSFNSQFGPVAVDSLPVLSGSSQSGPSASDFAAAVLSIEPRTKELPNMSTRAPHSPNRQNEDIPDLIEKLARLRHAGVLTENEFTTKKRELLSRI